MTTRSFAMAFANFSMEMKISPSWERHKNGAECIKLLAKLKPDILLLDLRMPDKDGLAVLEEVNFDTIPTRVIVLTAAEDDRDVVRAMRLGARGVVLKQSSNRSPGEEHPSCSRRGNLARQSYDG